MSDKHPVVYDEEYCCSYVILHQSPGHIIRAVVSDGGAITIEKMGIGSDCRYTDRVHIDCPDVQNFITGIKIAGAISGMYDAANEGVDETGEE